MTFRVVAIPLFAAICLASPVIASAEQAKKGRGYSPRGGGSGETATRSGGDSSRRSGEGDRTASTNNRPAERRAESRPESGGEERRAVSRRPEERRVEAAPRKLARKAGRRSAVPKAATTIATTSVNAMRFRVTTGR